MRIYDYFNLVFTPIVEEIKLLTDDRISDYLFDGKISFWLVLCCFFVGYVMIRFFLSPIRLNTKSTDKVIDKASK